jgi:hypothetical protein
VHLPIWATALLALTLLGVGGAVGAAGKSSGQTSKAVAAPVTENEATTTDLGQSPTTSPESTATESRPTTTAPRTTTTTVPVTTTTAAPTTGTRENPLPLGMPVPAGDWALTVISFEPDVTAAVAAFNQFNDAPVAGTQWSRMRLRAAWSGTGTGDPSSVQVNLVGATATTYGQDSVAGGSGDPQNLRDQPATFAGGTVEGYLYYQVTPADAAGKMLAFAPNVNYTDVPGGVGFFAVN